MIFTFPPTSSNNDNQQKESRPLLQKIIDSILLVGTATLTIVCGHALNRALQVYFIDNPGFKSSAAANFVLALACIVVAILILSLGLSSLLDGSTGDVRGCTDWDKVSQRLAYHIVNEQQKLNNQQSLNTPSNSSSNFDNTNSLSL